MTTLDTVRRLIGRRHKISRLEMRDILVEFARTGLYLGNGYVHDTVTYDRDGRPTDEQDVPRAARAWANMCTGIACISVDARGLRDGCVRYDQPGSMNPSQHAELTFAPSGLMDYEYLRRHADRLLIVRDDPPIPDAAEYTVPAPARWILGLRKSPRFDGTWVRVLDDGMLEMRDPNSGQSSDPRDKPRFQYRLNENRDVERRTLPAESVGDQWADIGVPEWEPVDMPPDSDIVWRWWEEQVM